MDTVTPPVSFWSFSSLKNFEACPFRIYLQRVERAPKPIFAEDADHPLVRGQRVHQEAEAFVKGEGIITRDLRKQAERLTELAEEYGKGLVEVEQKWWCNKNWSPVAEEHPDRWHLVICDAFHHISNQHGRVIDYKTGKSFGNEIKHGEQMQLYAIQAFMRYPDLVVVEVELIYLDENHSTLRRYDRTKISALISRWEKRAERLVTATHFPPKANKSNCRYCDFGPNNGGTGACPYGVPL